MGWNPFKKTVTYQYWNVATTSLTDKPLPDGFHDFAIINDSVNGIDYFKSLEYLNYNAGSRNNYRQITNKFSKYDYYGGFAEVNIGNNYVPASLVKARINPSDPSVVTIVSSSISTLDYAGWASTYLVNEFGLNTTTNKFTTDSIEFSVDFSTANSVDNTIEITNIVAASTTVLDLPPEPVGSSYNVTYTITTTTTADPPVTTVSSTRTWTYEIGSGVYPELDTYTTLPENDPTVFQIMPPLDIRKDGTYTHDDASRHADYDDYAKSLGIVPKDIADAFQDQSDMDKLDHITVGQGVDLKAKDKHSLRYCIDFITKLKNLADTHTFNYAVNGTNDNISRGFNTQNTRGYTDAANSTYTTSHRNVPTELVDIPGVDLVVSFNDFAYGLTYAHIDIQHHSKTEVDANTFLTDIRDVEVNVSDHGRVQGIKYKSVINNNFSLTYTNTGVTIDSGVWGYLDSIFQNLTTSTVSSITYYRINKDDSVDSYMLVAPVMSHYVRDAQSNQHKLVYISLESADADIYLPLDWRIVKSYNNQELTSLTTSSMHLIMYYAYWEQKEVWNWGLILLVVAIIVFVYTGYDISAALGKTAAALATTLGVTLSTAYIIMAVAYLASMGVFGEDYVILGQIALLAIGMGTSTSTLGANAYTAMNAIQVINIMNTYNMQHHISDAEQIASATISQGLLEDELQDALDEEYEASGYYYSAINRGYIQQALINIRKVDTLEAMPTAQYFQRVLKTTSPRHIYRLQYKYT